MKVKKYFYQFTKNQFRQFLIENQFQKFVANQVFDWVYKKHVVNPEKMNNISKDNRKKLDDLILINNKLKRNRLPPHHKLNSFFSSD